MLLWVNVVRHGRGPASPRQLLAQGEHIVPIPGTKKRERLAENLGATAVELSEQDLKRVDELAPAGSTAGARYPNMASIAT